MIFRSELEKAIKRSVKELYKLDLDPYLEHPKNENFGDYATGIALRIASGKQIDALEIARQLKDLLVTQLPGRLVTRIDVVKPGFINFWLNEGALVEEVREVNRMNDEYGRSDAREGEKILLEHTSPNPQTTIMLGHLRNNFLGMAMANLLEFSGAKVIKDCVVNDRGVHLCRAIWGYLVFAKKRGELGSRELQNFRGISESKIKAIVAVANWRELLSGWLGKKTAWYRPAELGLKPDHANLIWYVLGSRACGLEERVRTQVEEILVAWEGGDKGVRQVWKQILEWSAKGYAETYRRIGSVHDWVWYESDYWQKGREIVKAGLEKKVFRLSEGAVVTNLEKEHLPDTVVQKADGTTLYITQDLALTSLKCQKFPADLYIWDIGEEQSLYFKQLFAIVEQLGIAKRDKLFHLSYALINFKGGGKMATRKGDVVRADEILDELHRRAVEIIKSSNQKLRGKLSARGLERLAEAVAVGAVKYSLLKFSRETTIYFDVDESLALEGNSGPYLQYTYSRARSVLKKSGEKRLAVGNGKLAIGVEELPLLRYIYRFPEVIGDAVVANSPNLVCNYLFELAQRFNTFYDRVPIIKSGDSELKALRLGLTAAVAQVIKSGLTLLGIETPERL